ncbi:MAG TPA: DUF2252 domain-containing protein [Actinomycetes bacterium]|nr:DUF2252 domain-containing protein [Actinomycetes bacterium]
MATNKREPYRSAAERAAAGKAERERVPRSSHAEYQPAADRPHPVVTLELEGETRVKDLLPLRYQRMSATAFTFYRGSASVMAFDLHDGPRTKLSTQLCGDMHMANMGLYASPERTLLFDVNDFDETLPGPFEWDVKRLVTSFVIAGRTQDLPKKITRQAALACSSSYREAMAKLASQGTLDIWYTKVDEAKIREFGRAADASAQARTNAEREFKKARSRTSLSSVNKLTELVDGRRQFREDPPLLSREVVPDEAREMLPAVIDRYRRTLAHDRRHLLDRYSMVDVAHKVVGVGSVGTRAWVLLMQGRDDSDLLLLQAKEAATSVLEPYLGRSAFRHPGQRVVEGQRFMQAASDIFLGWADGVDESYKYYIRQLRDMKGGIDADNLQPGGITAYAQICGQTLARAHARGGDAIAIASYLGKSDSFDRALVEFAELYTEQNESDYSQMMLAIKDGTLPTES